ncbi:hypothetical protein J132_09676 [Termitomyces sp. J132]|nr:hypothetical protein J132_09676 [Termitomyces sp. J132]
MDDFQLTITPLQPAALPSEETVIAAGNRLIESTSTWKQGKTYHINVKTCHRPKSPADGAPWHCRISEHPPAEATFDQLWAKLGEDKALNEKEFIPEIKEVIKLKEVSPTASIWALYYTFTPPVSPRVFTVIQIRRLDTTSAKRRGMIVSLPIDLSGPEDKKLAALEPEGVRGRYVAVETITDLDNGNTEWRMATSSTPGGIIPSFVVETTMNSKIADVCINLSQTNFSLTNLQDVPHFMTWLRQLPK